MDESMKSFESAIELLTAFAELDTQLLMTTWSNTLSTSKDELKELIVCLCAIAIVFGKRVAQDSNMTLSQLLTTVSLDAQLKNGFLG